MFGARASEIAPRFDIVKGARVDAAPPAAAVPTPPPFAPTRAASWSPVPAAGQTAAVEQYRRLAGALIQGQVEHGIKVVMVTSSLAAEGKSLTAANLALTLSRSYQRETLLIDADQRAPSLHEIFHVDNTRGLSDCLSSPDGSRAATLQLFSGLTLMTAGRPTSDPMGGLTSARLQQLIAEAAAAFDFVIIDTPPVTLVPDASLMVALVDAAVLVIAAGSTQYETIERAVKTLGRDKILGTVLNRADRASAAYYGYGYPRT